jgi:hypothetical protein
VVPRGHTARQRRRVRALRPQRRGGAQHPARGLPPCQSHLERHALPAERAHLRPHAADRRRAAVLHRGGLRRSASGWDSCRR